MGEGLLFGLPGGAVVALPVALRAGGDLQQTVLVWLAALGLYGMLLGVITASVRVARPLPRRTPAVLLGLGFAFGPLALFGTLLVQRTHHRPLGAATYAVVAAAIALLAWAVANQALVSIHSAFKNRRAFGWALVTLGCLSSMALAALPVLGFFRQFGQAPLLSSVVSDGLLGMALAMLGGFARFPRKLEGTSRLTGPMAFGICAFAFGVAMQTPHTGPALTRVSVLWSWLG